jgi:hypothetical protein
MDKNTTSKQIFYHYQKESGACAARNMINILKVG